MKQFELYRSAHAEGGVAPLAVVENLQVIEDRIGQLDAGFPSFRLSSSVCILPQNDSMTALS